MEVGVPKQEDAEAALPLSSLRLLVPPLRLMAALLWRIMQQRDVMQYGMLADFVSLVTEAVPELFSHTRAVELIVGLRAKLILELCCRGQPMDECAIQSHLNRIQLSLVKDLYSAEVEEPGVPFVELVQTLIKNTDEREQFFQHVFPVEFGPDYDSALQTLMWDFLSRLEHFLPVPDLLQTVAWLSSESSALKDCEESISNSDNLKSLIHHHKCLGHLETLAFPASPPCPGMADCILTALSGKRDGMDPPGADGGLPEQPADSVPAPIPECVMDATDVSTMVVVSDWADVELGANPAAEFPSEVEDGARGGTGPRSARAEPRGVQTNRSAWVMGGIGSERGSVDEGYSGGDTLHHQEGDVQLQGTNRKRVDLTLNPNPAGQSGNPNRNPAGQSGNSNPNPAGQSDGNPVAMPTLVSLPHTCASAPEQAATLTYPTAIRRSARKPKKTWKIKMVNLQKQKRETRPACLTELVTHPHESNKRDSAELPDVSSGLTVNDGNTDVSLKVFSCPLCLFSHAQERYLKSHIKKIHPALQEGSEKEVHVRHVCHVCGKGYRYPGMLKAHERTHTGERPFQCPASRCGRHFSHVQALRRHRLVHVAQEAEPEARGAEPGAGEPRTYGCLYCGESFSSLSARRDHHRIHGRDELNRCSDCGKRLSCQAALVRHKRGHLDERPHKCTLCETSFACVTGFKRHLLAHRPERPYRCGCGKGFTYHGALLSHQRTHTAERKYRCAHCDKSFLYPGALRKHEWTHSQEKPHLCSHCGKSFKRERTLRAHLAGHTEEKAFRCSLCDKTFAYKASLTRHELTHTGERPFLCADCGKSFFSFGELLKHQRYHTGHKPFRCSHCDKSFTQACYLQLHTRYHTGVRPYACSQCGKSFFTSCRLKRHMQIHTGEKPFECSECGKGFRQAYVLKVHRRTHAGERRERVINDALF